MSPLPAAILALAAGLAVLATRRDARLASTIGLAGLALATLAVLAQRTGEHGTVGAVDLVVTDFGRAFSLFGLVGAMLGLASCGEPGRRADLAAGVLLAVGLGGLALACTDPTLGLVVAAGAWLATVPVILVAASGRRGLAAGGAHVRAAGITAAFAILAGAVAPDPLTALGLEPVTVGLMVVLLAATVAVGLGAVPFHGRTTRLGAAVHVTLLPAVVVPSSLALAAVATTWVDRVFSQAFVPLDVERRFIALVGIAGIAIGGWVAFRARTLRATIPSLIACQAGFVLVGLSTFSTTGLLAFRGWLLVTLILALGLGAWAGALERVSGSIRLDEVGGWARRSPILGLALVLLACAAVGWPGALVFQARLDLVAASIGEAWRVVGIVAALAWVLPVARIVLIGVGAPTAERRISGAIPVVPSGNPSRTEGRGRTIGSIRQRNAALRPGIAAGVSSLALALVALGVAAGALGASEGARNAGAVPTPAASPVPSSSPDASPSASVPPTQATPGASP